MVAGSITDENNDNTGAGSDLISPAPQPDGGMLNMENYEASKMLNLNKSGICPRQCEGLVS